jgi:hypothetical protein
MAEPSKAKEIALATLQFLWRALVAIGSFLLNGLLDVYEFVVEHWPFGQKVRVPRETPKGTRIVLQGKDWCYLDIKITVQYWGIILPALAVGILFYVPAPLTAYIAFRYGIWDFESVTKISWGIIIACLVVVYYCYTGTRYWIRVEVTPDRIKFGRRIYDRAFFNGMRIGYEDQNMLQMKNNFLDFSMGVRALRLGYGRWGDDLPYLVNNYHSAEIVVWMNEMIAQAGQPGAGDHAPELGVKQERF